MKKETITVTLNGFKLTSVMINSPDGYDLTFTYGENEIRKTCQKYIDVVLITQTIIMQFCLYAGVRLKF